MTTTPGALYSGTPTILKILVAVGVLLLLNEVAPAAASGVLLLIGLYVIVVHGDQVAAVVQSSTNYIAGAFNLAPSGSGGTVLPHGPGRPGLA